MQTNIKQFAFLCLCIFWLDLSGCGSEQVARDIQKNRQVRYETFLRSGGETGGPDMEAAVGRVSLDDCIELALKHNKQVQMAKLSLLEAKGQITEASSTALPKASFTGAGMRNDSSSFFSQKETYELGLLVRQPLYLGGLAGAALDAARVFAYQKQQQLRMVMQAVHFQVRQKYLAALLAEELIEVSRQAKRDAEKLLADTKMKLRYGTATRFEVLRSEVRLNAIEATLIHRQNASRLALTELLNVLGVSQTSQIELAGKLSHEIIGTAAGECFSIAMGQRPDLLIGEANIRLAQDNVKAERAGDRPKVYLQGSYQRSYPGFAANFSKLGEMGGSEDDGGEDGGGGFGDLGGKQWDRVISGGLVVEWPLFDGFATRGRIVKAKAMLQQQEVALEKLEQQVQFEITQAMLNLESSEKFVQSQIGNVANAEEALRLAQVGFHEGTSSSLDVISAELALSQARADYNQAVHDYQLAQLNLNSVMGTLGEETIHTVADSDGSREPTDDKVAADSTTETDDNTKIEDSEK